MAELTPSLIAELERIVGPANVFWRDNDLISYSYDGSIDRGRPNAVVLPGSTDEVVAIVKAAQRHDLPIVARGAGTGLSGGAIAHQGIMLGFSRMRRILEVDTDNMRATVEPGLVNLDLSKAIASRGFYYAPDPSSQAACTLGGNVAENSGGPHCLAYGVTTNHVLGLEVVLPNGQVVHLGGVSMAGENAGYDLTGAFVGSEGTLGIVTKITLRLMRLPEAVRTLLAIFPTIDDASRTVSAIIAAGIIPAALEMMDALTIQALQRAGHPGLPADAGAVLLIELEGLDEGMAELSTVVDGICTRHHARDIHVATTAEERTSLWKARKGALGALGQLAPNYYLQDGVVPRTLLPEVLQTVQAASEKYDLPIANVAHAGDGNLHPCIVFDERIPGQTEKVIAAGADILWKCVQVGGTLSGEHGVGLEKQAYMSWLFGPADFAAMRRLKRAFDPDGRLNPGKVFPTEEQMAAAEAWVQREDGATDAPADQEDLARREAAATAALAAATTLTAKSPAPVPVTGPVAAPYPAGSNGAQHRSGQVPPA